jgi:transcriptional regulator with XRE-family HTH domain
VRVPHPAKGIIVNRGLEQRAVARAVGLNHHTFCAVLNRRVDPWPALRSRLSDYLGLPESELFLSEEAA